MEDLKGAATSFAKLCEIVAKLRAPGGCPWDREQTNESLLPPLIEEAYEAAGAIRAKDDANLREELGDVILLAVMHAEIANETGRFNIDDAVKEVTAKLIRRHPHVFAQSDVKDAAGVLKQWEAMATGDQAKIADEIGDLLFAVVNLARKSGLDAEEALQAATNKFVARFSRVEDELRARGKKLGEVKLEELDALWNSLKKAPTT